MVFSPDGRFLALAAGKTARVWDCRENAFATAELKHPDLVATVAFHPQGHRLATGCWDRRGRVFPVPHDSDRPLFSPVVHCPHANPLFGIKPVGPTFIDEGRGLLTGTWKGETGWHDAETGKLLRLLPSRGPDSVWINSLAVSPDGRYFAVSRDDWVQLWDAKAVRSVGPLLRHRDKQFVVSASFSPDGQTLLTGAADHTARRWSVPGGQPQGAPLLHPTNVERVLFAPDGKSFVTAQHGGLARLWAVPGIFAGSSSIPLAGAKSHARFSADGRYVLATGMTYRYTTVRETRVYDVATGKPAGPPVPVGGLLMDAALSPDSQQLATGASLTESWKEREIGPGQQPGEVQFWDWRTGKPGGKPLRLPSEPRSLDYSPDGRRLAVLCSGGQLLLIDPLNGHILSQWQAHAPYPANNFWVQHGVVRFSPDGQGLVTWGTDEVVRVWEAAGGTERYRLRHGQLCHGLAFSPDGRLIATASWDHTARLWDFATGTPIGEPLVHPDWVFLAQFSPDGEHVLTACRDGAARVWDRHTGRPACPDLEHQHEVHAATFTPDGRWVLTASVDKTVRAWDWRAGKTVTPPLPVGAAALSVSIAPDGRHAVVGGLMDTLPVYCLDDLYAEGGLGREDLATWGELLSGRRIDGGVVNLTAEGWLDRWRTFRQHHPDYGPSLPEPTVAGP